MHLTYFLLDFRFSEEYEELKHVGREKPCAAADLPCNRFVTPVPWPI
jgi:hypothetical protein